ncbi:MAG: hypothetical protein V1817_03125 [Candidatus Micrarchaeota archaeon]
MEEVPVIKKMLDVGEVFRTGYGGKFSRQFKITALPNGRALKLILTHEAKTPLSSKDIAWIKKKFLENNRTIIVAATGKKISVVGFVHHTKLPTQLAERVTTGRLGTVLKSNQVTRLLGQRKR